MPSTDRLAAMPKPSRQQLVRLTGILLVAGLTLGACTAGPGATSGPVTSSPSPSQGSSGGVETGPGSGVVGGSPGPSVSHVPVDPVPMPPGGPGASGGGVPMPSPGIVQPVAGLLNIHDVRAAGISATSAAGRIVATVSWWSGPPPCSALAEVHVDRAGNAFTLTIREGAVQLGIACPAMAMAKATVVDLGAVPAGTYTVAATGVDVPVTVTIG